MTQQLITVIGGSGFVGTHVTRALVQLGHRVRVVSRDTERGSHLKMLGWVGQVDVVSGNLNNIDSITPHLRDADAVINLVGIAYESGRQCFHVLHAQAVAALAHAVKQAGISRFVQMSALGVDESRKSSAYAKSKYDGEILAMNNFPSVTIIRPSVIIGPQDNTINQFASLIANMPVVPLIGGGKTLFQPAYVSDVADAIAEAAINPHHAGKIYELVGPDTLSLRDLFEITAQSLGRTPTFVSLPKPLAYIMGACFSLLPSPLFTYDQAKLLNYDNISSAPAKNFASFGIKPLHIKPLIASYIRRFARDKAPHGVMTDTEKS